jgi:hypothetical protein
MCGSTMRVRFAIGTCVAALGSLALLAAPGQERQPPEEAVLPPAALRAFEQARRAIASGRIEWTVGETRHPDRTLNFVSRYARNGDVIYENRGDDDGWTIFNPETGEGFRRYPQLYMINADGTWHFEETTPSCGWYPKTWEQQQEHDLHLSHVRDARAIGVAPHSDSLEHRRGLAAQWPSADDPIERWSEQQDGDYVIVVGHHRSGAVRTWYIAADRGWNAERITLEFRGHPIFEVQCSLAKFGDVWFPAEARYYWRGEPTDCVTVTKASFNSADDSERFTPADLGLEPGSRIHEAGTGPRVGPDSLTWTGHGIVKFSEWLEGVKSGKWAWGPIHRRIHESGFESPYETQAEAQARRLQRRASQTRHYLERHALLWEEYVRTFVARYQLDREQREKANVILLECQRRAYEFMQRRRNDLTEIISRLLDASASGRSEEAARLRERLQEGLKPLDVIFEQSLKPRLEKLPTRAQRAAAEANAKSAEPGIRPDEPSNPKPP